MPTTRKSKKSKAPKGKPKAKADKPKQPAPPRLGGGVMRSPANRTRNTRGMFGADVNMMTRSILNTVNNLPSFLQRHVDDRMKSMHDALLFRRDEEKRSKPEPMDEDPPPPPPEPMDDSATPPISRSSSDASMASARDVSMAPSQSREPMTRSQVQASVQTQRPPAPPVNMRYVPPTRVTIRRESIVVVPPPKVETKSAGTSYNPPIAGQKRERSAGEFLGFGQADPERPHKFHRGSEMPGITQATRLEFQEAARRSRMPRRQRGENFSSPD